MFEIFPVGQGSIYVRGNDKIVINFVPDSYIWSPNMMRFAERFWK